MEFDWGLAGGGGRECGGLTCGGVQTFGGRTTVGKQTDRRQERQCQSGGSRLSQFHQATEWVLYDGRIMAQAGGAATQIPTSCVLIGHLQFPGVRLVGETNPEEFVGR